MGGRERSELDLARQIRRDRRAIELAGALRVTSLGLPEGWHVDMEPSGQLRLTPPHDSHPVGRPAA